VFTPARLTVTGVKDIVFDAVSGKIYAAVSGNPGTVVPIDPATRSAGTPITVGIDPIKLALSDDGQYLYVALDGEPAVQRIVLATGTVDLKFGLGEPDPGIGFSGTRYVEDMQVLPGNAHAIAASLKFKGSSPRHAGVAVFADGVRLPNQTFPHTGSNVIEFSASSNTLYGYNNETTEFGFRRMAVDTSGVTIVDVYDSFHAGGGLIDQFSADIAFGAGLVFSTNGRVIDPSVPGLVGLVALPITFGNVVVPDGAVGRVFYLANEGGGVFGMRAFDVVTRLQVGSLNLGTIGGPADPPPTSLIRYGARGLAFRSGDDVVFVESTALIP
jgi:hypothetical protein